MGLLLVMCCLCSDGTWRVLQGRVTDHRIGLTEHGMQAMLDGSSLHSFIEALQQHHKQELLAEVK